jgi:hypothetical protein
MPARVRKTSAEKDPEKQLKAFIAKFDRKDSG